MIAISWICLKKTVLPLSRSLFSVKWLHLLQRPSCLYFELKVWISGQQKPRETEGDAKETVSAAELINMVWRYTQRSKVLWLFHCSCFISGCLVWNCFVTNCIFTWNCTYNVRLSCNASFRCHTCRKDFHKGHTGVSSVIRPTASLLSPCSSFLKYAF